MRCVTALAFPVGLSSGTVEVSFKSPTDVNDITHWEIKIAIKVTDVNNTGVYVDVQ